MPTPPPPPPPPPPLTPSPPPTQTLTTTSGTRVRYDHLVVCPGIQLDWAAIPGMAESLDTPTVSSNYRHDLATKTWDRIEEDAFGDGDDTSQCSHTTSGLKRTMIAKRLVVQVLIPLL